MSRIVVSLLVLLITSQCIAQEFYNTKHVSKKDQLPYLISIPETYDNDDTNYPLLIFLHGGDRSNTKHHPKKYATEQGIDIPMIIAAPHCSRGCSWSRVDFEALVNEISENFRIDKTKIFITGYSMGGYGTWSALTNYPKLFAAAAPICGGGNPNKICVVKNTSIKAFHAKDDNVTPYSGSKNMVKALESCNGKIELISYNSGGHGIWPSIFRDNEFYDWFMTKSIND